MQSKRSFTLLNCIISFSLLVKTKESWSKGECGSFKTAVTPAEERTACRQVGGRAHVRMCVCVVAVPKCGLSRLFPVWQPVPKFANYGHSRARVHV